MLIIHHVGYIISMEKQLLEMQDVPAGYNSMEDYQQQQGEDEEYKGGKSHKHLTADDKKLLTLVEEDDLTEVDNFLTVRIILY